MHRLLLIVLCLLLTACHGVDESPSTPAADTRTLKVVSYNVWYGFTKKPERKAPYLAWMEQQAPDVVSLQELNGYSETTLADDAGAWGHKHSVLLKRDGFPTGLTSNQPITNVKRVLDGFHHGLIRARTHGITFYVIHLHPSDWEVRHREIDLLIKDVQSLAQGTPVMLIGDFNTFSLRDKAVYDEYDDMVPFFSRLDERWTQKNLRDGQLDYTHITKLESAGLIDLGAKMRREFRGTFPTKLRLDEDMGPARRLDYIFTNKALAKRCRTARYILDDTTGVLSDHYPIVATFDAP